MKTLNLKNILLVLVLALVPFSLVWALLFVLLKKFIRAGILGLMASRTTGDVTRWRGEADDGPLSEFLTSRPGIRRLTLGGSDAADAQVALLSGLKNLEELDLSHTGITDAGLEHLATLGKLRSLCLNGTDCSGDGLMRLVRPGGLKGLREIYLYGTRVTGDDVDGFKRLCRGCVVVAGNGRDTERPPAPAGVRPPASILTPGGKTAAAAMGFLQSPPVVKNPQKASGDFKWTNLIDGGSATASSGATPASGYLMIWLTGGQTVYWLNGGEAIKGDGREGDGRGPEVVRCIEMDSRIKVLKHFQGSIYGMNGFGLFEYSPDLKPAFSSASFTARLLSQRRLHGISPRPDIVKTPRGTYLFLSRTKIGPFDYDDEIIEADIRGDILWAWSANENLAGAGHLPCGGLQGLELTDDGGVLVISGGAARPLMRGAKPPLMRGAKPPLTRGAEPPLCQAEVVRVEYPSGSVTWRRPIALKPLSVSAMPDGGALIAGEDFQDGKARISILDGSGAEILGRRFEFDAHGAFSACKISPGGGWLITDGAAGEVIEYSEDFVEIVRVGFLKATGGGFPNGPATGPVLGAAKVESVPCVKKSGGLL